MMRKGLFVLVLVVFITGGLFSQEASSDGVHKHEPFDMLIGLNFGFGITPNIGKVFSISEGSIPKGNFAIIFDFGLTFDFYLFNWLSFNSGLLVHPDIYLLLEREITIGSDESFTDYAATPICLTIPLMAHVNIPKVEWVYVGIGLNFNIPVSSMLDSVAPDIDTKGDAFVGLPIDIGFDFIKPGRGGGRFFFRITPEFHKKGTAVPIGFIWQIYNWKIYSNSNSK